MTELSQLFLYIPGIFIFLAGSGQVRRWLKMHGQGVCVQASVVSCRHVVKKDKKGRETYNYYDVLVEYVNPRTKHHERHAVKSPAEYARGQQVKVYLDKSSGQMGLAETEDEQVFHPLVTMIGGALMILLAFFENHGDQVMAMVCLAAVSAGAGMAMIMNYVKLKRAGLAQIDAEIIDIYERQISKETKILKGSKYTYYPVVRYRVDGRDAVRLCKMNSERKQAFETGEYLKLYYDEKTGSVLERNARAGVAVAGAVLLVIGVLVGGSVLVVI